VQGGFELRTDDWSGLNGIEIMGYEHTMINIANRGDAEYFLKELADFTDHDFFVEMVPGNFAECFLLL